VRQRRAAVVRHPGTGEDCWFNDVAFFSQWSVDAEEREVLLAAFGPDGIPYNTSFGNGGPLGEPDWRRVLDAYDAVMSRVEWRAGDVLVLDNLLTAHGREPFTGDWETAVAPAEPVGLPAHPC
jgi:alpha-ketoglutarate-dependent taurine dioxygenase